MVTGCQAACPNTNEALQLHGASMMYAVIVIFMSRCLLRLQACFSMRTRWRISCGPGAATLSLGESTVHVHAVCLAEPVTCPVG